MTLLAGLLVVSPFAAYGKSNVSNGVLFRYVDKTGKTVISSNLTTEALYAGYQILDSNGQVLKKVAPGIPEEKRAKYRAKRKQAAHDKKLLKMYVSPSGAKRTRDRQVEAIQLKISYARNELIREKAKRDKQIARAAKFQKRGAKVPETVTDLINLYSGKVKSSQKTIDSYQADIDSINDKFDSIISRLETLTGKTVSGDKPTKKTARTDKKSSD